MRFINDPGSEVRDVYALVKDEFTGASEVKLVGTENIQSYIDSFADSCNVANIVSRAVCGDDSLLNAVNGVYGDFTNYPSTLADALNSIVRSQETFDNLPDDVRSKFNNSYVDFANYVSSDSFVANLNSSEVVDNES